MERGLNWELRTLFPDTVSNTLYAGGRFSKTGLYNDTDGMWVRGIAQWDGSKWDSLGCGVDRWDCSIPQSPSEFPAAVMGIAKYKGEIYAGGAFRYADEIPVTGIAKWNGANWDTVTTVKVGTQQGAIRGFLVYNDELYVFGTFDSIGGIAADMIAKFDGTNWYGFPPLDGPSINTAMMYKGKLYIGGNMNTNGNGLEDIARFNFTTNQWETVGGGATCDCWINKFYIWRDTLIVAGYFQSLGGLPFNNIAAWDGNNWIELGDGVLPSNVWDVIEYDNKLYACGQISYLPNGDTIHRMAKWDGQEWTDEGLDFNGGTPTCFAVLNDELYIGGGGFITVNGDTVNNIVKYTLNTGIAETGNKNEIKISPNPAINQIIIQSNFSFSGTLVLYDITGRKIFHSPLSNIEHPISITHLSKGIYIYEIRNDEQVHWGKLVKD